MVLCGSILSMIREHLGHSIFRYERLFSPFVMIGSFPLQIYTHHTTTYAYGIFSKL